jgi:hypothetical protein
MVKLPRLGQLYTLVLFNPLSVHAMDSLHSVSVQTSPWLALNACDENKIRAMKMIFDMGFPLVAV